MAEKNTRRSRTTTYARVLLFIFYFFRDIGNGYFTWDWTAILFLLFIPVGFLMSRVVPMRVDEESRAVILSLDCVYLILIWVLVIIRLVTNRIAALIPISDIIMCAILGIMFGRLGGIGTRVRGLKLRYGLIKG